MVESLLIFSTYLIYVQIESAQRVDTDERENARTVINA